MSVERRQVDLSTAELRILRDDHGTRSLEGYAAKFGVLSNELPGKFKERIDPHAFDRFKQFDVRAVIDHDPARLLGRTKSGTLELTVDERGLRYRVPSLPDTSYVRDLEEQIKRRDVDGNSFAFRCKKDSWAVEDGVSVRTLLDVDLIDVCPTPAPCYPDTEVALRSMTSWQESTKPPIPNLRPFKQRIREMSIS